MNNNKRYQYKTHAAKARLGTANDGKELVATACNKAVEEARISSSFTCILCTLAVNAAKGTPR